MSYQRQKEVLEMPALIGGLVKDSDWTGTSPIFEDISPIEDYSDKLSLDFVDFELCRDEVKYPIEEYKNGMRITRRP